MRHIAGGRFFRSLTPLLLTVLYATGAAGAQSAPEGGVPPGSNGRELPAAIRIGPGDLLEINVYNAPDLSRPQRVTAEGEIYVPLIGRALVAGLTTGEAQTLIEKRLLDGRFINEPHVSILIRDFATQGVSVMGEVMKPGIYSFPGPRRLLDVISAAGGLSAKAGPTLTLVRRDRPNEPVSVPLPNNPEELIAGNLEIQPGDTVVVSKAGVIYVVGEVTKPGGFNMENNTSLTVLQAIALAQGLKSTASLNGSKLIRRRPAGTQELDLPLKKMLAGKAPDMQLEEDDIVFVPSSLGKSAAKRTVEAAVQMAVGAVIWRGR